jgi:hypothetical protein
MKSEGIPSVCVGSFTADYQLQKQETEFPRPRVFTAAACNCASAFVYYREELTKKEGTCKNLREKGRDNENKAGKRTRATIIKEESEYKRNKAKRGIKRQ